MATSFKKKTTSRGRPSLPIGTKPSLNNNQLLVSTGCPSLDTLLGGGLAVGTLLLLEEDVHASYANILKRLFIAEGVACNQGLFVASADQNPEDILKDTPKDANEEKYIEKEKQKVDNDDLKIAWRYQNQPKVQSSISASQFGHYFDLSETITEEKIKSINYTCFTPSSMDCRSDTKGKKTAYVNMLQSMQERIEKDKLYTHNSTTIPSILRINLQSIGSPCWNEKLINSDNYHPDLAWFLISLKSLLRRSYSVCLITIPTYLFEETYFVNRIEHCCDAVIHLESFVTSDKSQNPLYKEYHGLFHIKKVPRINSICGENIDTSDLAFKVKRKKFLIEKLHLPPDISETASRSQVNTSQLKPGAPLCSATTPVNNLLDF